MNWQPIETAPRDASNILAFVPRIGVGTLVLFWRDHHWREPANYMALKINPTHWMPLPSPPTTDGLSQAAEGDE